MRRSAISSLVGDLDRQADCPRDASTCFDLVDFGRLRLIEHLERGASC